MRPRAALLAMALAAGLWGCQRPRAEPAASASAAAAPAEPAGPAPSASPPAEAPARRPRVPRMVLIRGGTFTMGTADGFPHEGPPHRVTVRSFWLDTHEVTVAEFRRFVEETGFVTLAERMGSGMVFDLRRRAWNQFAEGATWRHPEGPPARPRDDEPVTQVSWHDAAAYAAWAGKRLPTEAEWEFAARDGLSGRRFPWGDELAPGGRHRMNVWQGPAPERDTGEDGWRGRAPVCQYPPSRLGLYDMAGNVWEWCADWFDPDYYRASPAVDPRGPAAGEERVIRGGSWLCSEGFCQGYRVAARNHTTPDSMFSHQGFRCARDADPKRGGRG